VAPRIAPSEATRLAEHLPFRFSALMRSASAHLQTYAIQVNFEAGLGYGDRVILFAQMLCGCEACNAIASGGPE